MTIPLTQASQIPYREHNEGYDEDQGVGNTSAVLRRRVYWGDKERFKLDMIGYSQSQVGKRSVTRLLPEKHPTMPWLWGSRCKFVGYTGAQDADGIGNIKFSEAIYDVVFTARNYDLKTDEQLGGFGELERFVERKTNFSVENFSIPGRSFKWVQGTHDPLESNAVRIFGSRELTYIWHQVPFVPTNNIDVCLGKVNNAYFDPIGNAGTLNVNDGYPPGTLLLAGVEIDDSQNEKGRSAAIRVNSTDNNFNITYKFIYRLNTNYTIVAGSPQGSNFATASTGVANDPLGWNYVWRNARSQFELVTSEVAPGDGNAGTVNGLRVYQSADFGQLFNQLNLPLV